RENLINNKNIVYLNKFVNYDSEVVGRFIDFYWRGLNDQSISYSLYEAATVNKPTLALNVGHVANDVKEYRLGAVVDRDMSNLKASLQELFSWSETHAVSFLKNHTWDGSASKLKIALEDIDKS